MATQFRDWRQHDAAGFRRTSMRASCALILRCHYVMRTLPVCTRVSDMTPLAKLGTGLASVVPQLCRFTLAHSSARPTEFLLTGAPELSPRSDDQEHSTTLGGSSSASIYRRIFRLDRHREPVDRLFRLEHASRVDQIEAAFKMLHRMSMCGQPTRAEPPWREPFPRCGRR